MIKKINIKNIQSHKNTSLELSSGVNAIIGSSNNGKSAILRALYWVRYNRPLGTDTLLSHWAVDKKGNQIASMEVTVENEKGTVIRKRSKDQNQYIINDKELNVVKTDVPDEVEKVLSLTDTNIQKQQDAPFLLSLSSGQVAQYFNKTVRLDIIDRVLSNAESKRRKTVQEIKTNEENLADIEKQQKELSWLDDAEKYLNKYERLSEKKAEKDDIIDELSSQIEDYDEYNDNLKEYDFISNAKEIIRRIFKLYDKFKENQFHINKLHLDVENYDSLTKNSFGSFDKAKKIISQIKKIDLNDIDDQINSLSNNIENFDKYSAYIKATKNKIIELRNQLPDICPLCGAKMKDGKCVEE